MSLTAAWALLKGLASSWQYVAITAALAWAGIAQIGWNDCKAGRLADQAEAQAAVIAFREADAAKSRAIEDAHAAELARLKGEANAREGAILRSASSTACLNSPLLALSSTACQQARPVLVQRQVPAELVRPCPAEPERPAFVDDRDLFVWLSRTLQAGAECRAAHASLAEWATSAGAP